MHLDDPQSALLKTWVIKKLENISDADSDVLADYVLALVKTDEPTHVAKQNCVDNLQDFLGDSSKAFVGDLFSAIDTGAYDPTRPGKPRQQAQSSSLQNASQRQPKQQHGSRKRAYHDWDGDASQKTGTYGSDNSMRPMKHARRGGRMSADRRSEQHNSMDGSRLAMPANGFPQMPTPPPGMPSFDPNNPMASFLAMQQIMSMFPGGMPGFPLGGTQQERCKDYDTKGFCAKGAACPFEHGNNPYLMPGSEYNPAQSSILHIQPSRTGMIQKGGGSGGRDGGRRARGASNARNGGKRANTSQQGSHNDQSATAVIVENIPEDKVDEDTVRDFFSQFGGISNVSLQPQKRGAVVTFETHEAAKAAIDSPKVVFDNRFVKVSWNRPSDGRRQRNQPQASLRSQEHGHSADVEMAEVVQPPDPAEVARKQEEAQRKYEENKRHREEQQRQKQDLATKLQAIEAERAKMAAKIASKTGAETTSAQGSDGEAHASEDARNASLRAQLAQLEAEAKSLGIDPNAAIGEGSQVGSSFRGRGGGGFRGRGGRGRGAPAYRGGWAGGAVKRLDNRPKTIAITFLDGTYADHDEALRQWMLFNCSDKAVLSPHPARPDAALLAFPERYLGEMFLKAAGAPDFPLVGRVELAWYVPEVSHDPPMEAAANASTVAAVEVSDVQHKVNDSHHAAKEVDYDVVADDELWG